MSIPNQYDLISFVLNIGSFLFLISGVIVILVNKGLKNHKKAVIILFILALIAFAGSKLVMNAKPPFNCPSGLGHCDNI